MRQSTAAVALIRRQQRGQTVWLAQWNPGWQRYHFVAGHKRPNETFRECAEREIGEELDLQKGSDFTVDEEPLAHLEYTAWSEGAKAETNYTAELFQVELNGYAAWERVEANTANRWLSKEEIRSGHCGDGAPVSETMRFFLSKVEGMDPC